MSVNFCIPKELTEKFVKAVRSGKIDPAALSKMTSEARSVALESHFGSLADDINKELESSLFNQKREYITDEEAKTITEMTKDIQEAKDKITPDMPKDAQERYDYGLKRALLQDYVGKMKESNKVFSKYYLNNPKEAVYDLAGSIKGIVFSLDDSFFGRQGIKTLFSTPSIWFKNIAKSLGDIGKELLGKDAMLAIKADVLSRPNALNGKYEAGGYDLGVGHEESFPSSLPEKIPVFGRIFKASETAFNGAAMRIRADLADRVIETAEKNGVDTLDPYQAQSLGKLVNSMTGRGKWKMFSESGLKKMNVAFASLKFLKSNFDALTAHAFDTDMSGYAKKQAAYNLVKYTASIAAIMAISNALHPGSVELDPRSSDFGKIRIGDTRFDITGGMAAFITLAARLATLSTKSSTTGKVTKLSTGKFGVKTGTELIEDFFENKASPPLQFVEDYLNQQDFNGNKFTVPKELEKLVLPMSIANFQEMASDPKSADPILGLIIDSLGFSSSTYSSKK